jgi:ABC-2 type transport system permease protein
MSDALAQARSQSIDAQSLKKVSKNTGFFSGIPSSYADIWRHRDLLAQLTRREIRAKYKASALGLLWNLIRPLTQLLIYYFAIGQVLGAARSIPNFAIFVFGGLTLWGLYVEVLSLSPQTLLGNGGIVKKVYVPRELFTMSMMGNALLNFAIQCILLLGLAFLTGARPFIGMIGYGLLGLAIVVVLSFGLGLLISAINVYIRDVEHFVGVILAIFFWLSPIVYSYGFIKQTIGGFWLDLYLSNPITVAIMGFQKAVWRSGSETVGTWPDDLMNRLWIALAFSIVFTFIAQRIFSRMQRSIAQEL